MALTMVHLLVAEKWAQMHPEFHACPEFYLGAISPDAIHVRYKSDKSRKNEFHLNNWVTPNPEDVIAYWKDRRSAFDVGYGVHVLTDGQWVPRNKVRHPDMYFENGLLNTDIYYNDTFVTDFALFRNTSWTGDIFGLIERAVPASDHLYLTYEEFDIWRKTTIDTYRGECPMNRPVTFIDENYVLEFVEDSIALIEDTYRRAFE